MRRLLGALVVVVAAACRDQSATQYVGTVMNDASPEAAGRLTVTFYMRTDTSFSGIIEVGPPATGTGSVYAWHEGSELRIVSVAAAGSDTILWTSKLTDEGLGGRFEVTGGERTGQGGTWRARLTRGPPATPATLRLPQSTALPPLSAMWPLLLLAFAGAWLARWIRRAPQPIVGDVAAASAPAELKSGVSGWLALFVISQLLGIITVLVRFDSLRTEYADSIGVGAAVTGMRPMVVLEQAVQLLSPVLALVGVVLIVRRSRYAPRYWFACLISIAAYLAVDLSLTTYVDSELKRLLGAAYAESRANDFTARGMAWQLVLRLIWSLYWVRSERVRVTFGAAALDRSARATPIALAPDATTLAPPSQPRRWRRAVLRAVGAFAAVVVVLVAVTAWQTRVSPYSVPAGTDIRKFVTGRWAWTTDKERCANAHIIAFSDDGKVMTIVQPSHDIVLSETTTTYDIELATQSTIRGAIRGETRLTGGGKPVVWDLVLVGPNAYRWRRTDWPSLWGYTASIIRCPASAPADTANR